MVGKKHAVNDDPKKPGLTKPGNSDTGRGLKNKVKDRFRPYC